MARGPSGGFPTAHALAVMAAQAKVNSSLDEIAAEFDTLSSFALCVIATAALNVLGKRADSVGPRP